MNKSVKEIFGEDQISLFDLFSLLKQRAKIIYISSLVFFIIGFLIAITSPEEYEAEALVLSESNTGNRAAQFQGLSGLAGLAGINLSEGLSGITEELGPDMYPAIASSQPFLGELMDEKFFFQRKGKEMSLFEYFSEEKRGHIFFNFFNFIRSLPSRIVGIIEKEPIWQTPHKSDIPNSQGPILSGLFDDKIVYLSPQEKYVIEELKSRIEIVAEKRIITVKVKMPEPYLSAQLNSVVLKKIIAYVIEYKTIKQRENLKFIEENTKEAKHKFLEAQVRLASFRDSNQGISSQKLRTIEQLLEYEFNLSFNVYNGLSQQLEQTKIQLKEETPLFTTFQPAHIPLAKSSPKILKIIILYTFLGIFIGIVLIVFVVIRHYFRETSAFSTTK